VEIGLWRRDWKLGRFLGELGEFWAIGRFFHVYTEHELCHKKLVFEKMHLGVNFLVVILVLISMPEAKSSHNKVVVDTIWHKGMSLVESVM
jgi:hypothetical protein